MVVVVLFVVGSKCYGSDGNGGVARSVSSG